SAASAASAARARASDPSAVTGGFYAPPAARRALAGVRSVAMPAHPALVYLVTGAFTGLVGAMLGIGGGVFLVPILTLTLHVPIRAAVAASLVSVIATATATSTVNLERGLVNMRL